MILLIMFKNVKIVGNPIGEVVRFVSYSVAEGRECTTFMFAFWSSIYKLWIKGDIESLK